MSILGFGPSAAEFLVNSGVITWPAATGIAPYSYHGDNIIVSSSPCGNSALRVICWLNGSFSVYFTLNRRELDVFQFNSIDYDMIKCIHDSLLLMGPKWPASYFDVTHLL